MSLAPSYSSPFFEKWLLHEVLEFLKKGIKLAAIVVTFLARLCVQTNDVNFFPFHRLHASPYENVTGRSITRSIIIFFFWVQNSHAYRKSCRFEFYEFMIFILSTPSSHHQLSIWTFLSSERTQWAHHKSIDKSFEFKWKVYSQVRERTRSIVWLWPIEHLSHRRFFRSINSFTISSWSWAWHIDTKATIQTLYKTIVFSLSSSSSFYFIIISFKDGVWASSCYVILTEN